MAKKTSPGCAAIAITFEKFPSCQPAVSLGDCPGNCPAFKKSVPIETAATLPPVAIKKLRRVVEDIIRSPFAELHLFNRRSYSSYTRFVLSAGIPCTLGDTNTGGVCPFAARFAATCAMIDIAIVMHATVEPAATG